MKKNNILMIPNKKGWHFLEIKILFALLGEIMSKYVGNFYCLNCSKISFTAKSKTESHKTVFKNKGLLGAVIPFEGTKILELKQNWVSDETPRVIYTHLLPLIKK